MGNKRKGLGCLVLVTVLLFSNVSYADQISELKKKNEEAQGKLEEVEEQISDLEGEQEGLDSQIHSMQGEIVELMAAMEILEDEITEKEEQVAQARQQLEQALLEEEKQQTAMSCRVKYLYETGQQSVWDMLLSFQSLEDLINRADYMEKIFAYDHQQLEAFQNARMEVESSKENLEIEQSELETTLLEYEEEKTGLDATLEELQTVSSEYAKLISKAKQQAQVYKTQIKQQNAQIAKLEEEARKKAEEEARKKQQQAAGSAKVDEDFIRSANGSEEGKKIAIYACSFVGNPYVMGGTSLTNGADCSGFTQSVYAAFGYKIPRTSYQQRSAGTQVSYQDAQPGDLICYAGHVAMYIGNGRIVHASSAKTGIKLGYATYREILSVRRIIK